MANEIWLFICAVFQATWAICTGGLVTVALYLIKRLWKRDLAWTWIAIVVVAALFVSCFLAWHGLYGQKQTQNAAIGRLTREKVAQEGETKAWQAKAEARQDEISRLNGKLAEKSSSSRVQVIPVPTQVPRPVPPLPEKGIMIVRQGDVSPGRTESAYVQEVVLRTKTDLQPTWLVLKCNAPVRAVTYYLKDGSNVEGQGKYYSPDRKTVWFHFGSPAFTVDASLVVRLTGPGRIRALYADEGRPPAGLKEEGQVGLQVTL